MKTTVFSVVLVLAATLPVFGKTYYVNCQLGDYAGHDGSTPELAFETIQEAIRKCAAVGDEVVVYPGVYNKGLGRTYNPETKQHWWRNTRLAVGDRDVLIRSTGGADVTHIVGAHDPETVDGFGTNAVRCIDAEKPVDSTRKTVFKGFTIRDGATVDKTSCPGQGGAVMITSGSNEGNRNVFFEDCVFSNCIGAESIFHGGTYIRCLFADNNMTKAATHDIHFCFSANFMHCVFTRNSVIDDTGEVNLSRSCHIVSRSSTDYSTFVNCTMVDNLARWHNNNHAHWYNSVCSFSHIALDDGAVRANVLVDSSSKRLLMAPTLSDWCVRKGSEAENAGNAEYLTDPSIIPLPDSIERLKDFYGNPIDVSSGTVAAGAVQKAVEPKGGALVAANSSVTIDAPGRIYSASSGAYVHPSVYPTNYLFGVNVQEGRRLRAFLLSGQLNGERKYVYPTDYKNDVRHFTPSPNSDETVTVNYETAPVLFVDKNSGAAESEQDGSEARPFSSLQQAVDAATVAGAVVVVAPGVYDQGGGEMVFSDATVKGRVVIPSDKLMRFVSSGGPEKTVITGAPDPANLAGDGCGSGATMTVIMSGRSALQGFTVTRGYSGASATFAGSGRGSLYSYGEDLSLTDCIITNNHGRNSALGTARFERCRIENNVGGTGLTMAAKLISCIIANNTITGKGYYLQDSVNFVEGVENGYWSTYALNCSISGDGVHGIMQGQSVHSKFVNSVFDMGGVINANDTHLASVYGSVMNGFLGVNFGGRYIRLNPMFAGGNPFDARVYEHSAAKDSGVSPAADPTGIWWYMCTADFNGGPWQYDEEGRPIAGAVQDPLSGGVYVGGGAGGFQIVGGGQFGYNDLEDGSSVTVKIVDGALRPLAGFLVNGVTNLIEENSSVLSGLTVECKDGVSNSVIPLYSPDNAWYVDAVNGDDNFFGYAPGCAWKTFEKAFANANLAAGDKVVALPGVYDKGTMIQSGSNVVRARAVVPAGVTLESSGGSAVTFIKGELAETDDVSTSAAYNAAMRGLGKTAVRGVYLSGSTSVVRGFTFTNCYTRGASDAGGSLHSDVEGCGAGVAGAYADGLVERCVFTDCHAFRGGGIFRVTAVDCVFDGCHALYAGGATTDNKNYGCLTKNNVCTANAQWGGFFYWSVCDNCTVLDSLGGPSSSRYQLRNALVTGKMGPWDWASKPEYNMIDGHNFTNCFILAQSGSVAESYRRFIEAGTGCIVTNDASALSVDDDGRPVIGANLAVDAADETASENIGKTDLSGAQRVYNGSRDAGALEADWRGVYGEDIRRRVVTVLEAGENVVETVAKKVRIPSGESLAAEFDGYSRKYVLVAKMVGEGTFKVTVDGVESVYSAGDIEHPIVLAEGGSFVDMVCEGGGYAEIVAVRGTGGMNLIVR